MAQESKTEEKTSKAIVIDNGTGMMKAGISGENAPSTIFPTLIGHLKQSPLYHGMPKKDYIGKEIQSKLAALSLMHPIEYGKIKRWTDMECIYSHIFENELKISPEEYGILITEPALTTKSDREKLTEMMFETFNCFKYYCSQQSILALYASGRTSGVVLDIGETCTGYTPIWEGYCLGQAVIQEKYGGRNVTVYLQTLLKQKGYSFTPSIELQIMNNIKEKLCYIAMDYDEEINKYKALKNNKLEQDYEMPDGAVISVGMPRFQAVEGLFKPKLMDYNNDFGIHLMVCSIGKIDMDLRKVLYENILLCGGSSLFPGIGKRLKNEVVLRTPSKMNVNIVANEDRKYAVWRGGSVLSSMESFDKMWINRDEFEECGPSIVHRKCI
eukprot:206910_1